MQGELHAKRLSWFQKLEGDAERGDKREGAIVYLSKGTILELESFNEETGEKTDLTLYSENIVGPIVLRLNQFKSLNLFCMYGTDPDILIAVQSGGIQNHRQPLELPKGLSKLGRHVVIVINVVEFLKRVEKAIRRQGYVAWCGSVSYYDPGTGTPPEPPNITTVFLKDKKYAHQQEFRFAIHTGTAGSDPITLNIGEVGDIAMRFQADDISQ